MERIHVAVRARPLSAEDAKNSPWRISGNSISISTHSKFEFDRIFGEDCKTVDVYEARTKEIVAAAVRGFNGTVFAYGQTNSGKTHTMRGSITEPGVIPLAVQDLFDIIQEDIDREFLLRMSYMEIYNEEINDLLAPEHRKLQIHESIERGIFVAGLREEIVASPEQVLELMNFGESHRHFGETNMNLYSSRSHTIFRMIIESRDRTEDEESHIFCDAVRVSVLNLVDLAGSERAAKTGAEGVRLKEGSHINKSLMTLGTVIKKLSEGAESQGGHVPYRDSKLTRILQPALGGNANTAIICNITLAQIHMDETRSSLQFASRALRVTNCAHVNEILTDAALLKRQKKEIEELRAKLQGSHSDHFEEEILNLRNTLLQTELERERIALELEEEKKAQAERERRLQEQAKKIENLSSMVLCSNRDESRDYYRKEKRRDTWCLGSLSKETFRELYSTDQAKSSAVKPMRTECSIGPLLPFEELVNEVNIDSTCVQEEDSASNGLGDSSLPDPHALLHVTSRRKVPLRKKSLIVENNELEEMQSEYEDLLLKFETQLTMSEVQIDYLTRKLSGEDFEKRNCSTYHPNIKTIYEDLNTSLQESEAAVIKQLQEKIKMLELEKSSKRKNLDCIVELAVEQNICARETYEELYKKLIDAREDTRVAREQLTSMESTRTSDEVCFDMNTLLMEVQEIISEIQASTKLAECIPSYIDELFQSFYAILKMFVEFRSLACQNTLQLKCIISDQEKLNCCMGSKVNELETEKLHLHDISVGFRNQIQELTQSVQSSAKALRELSEQREAEKTEFLSQIRALENEISSLSSCSLAREKENMRKDLEKTRAKLRDTEFKLRNAIQEKTKLEGEKACANREIKRLHGQNAILERDISKSDSLAWRRQDSVMNRSSNVFDPKIANGLSLSDEQTVQEDYKKLEVLAFEMETTIASLEEELAAAYEEKEQAMLRNEGLVSELQVFSDKLNSSNSELSMFQEQVSSLKLSLEEFKSNNQKMESSINLLVEQKEELAMQLTDALLAMEEEKAIWSSKEKASIEAIEERANLYNAEIMLLSKRMAEVTNELESCREQCNALEKRLAFSEENSKMGSCSLEEYLGNDQLGNDCRMAGDQNKWSEEDLKNQLLIMTSERNELMTHMIQIKEHKNHEEFDLYKESYDDMLSKAKAEVEKLTGRLSGSEVKLHSDEASNKKEKAKLRMRLVWTQAKLDAFRARYTEIVDEMDFMNKKFEEASAKLKDKLTSCGIENLNLKKLLAANGQ